MYFDRQDRINKLVIEVVRTYVVLIKVDGDDGFGEIDGEFEIKAEVVPENQETIRRLRQG